MVGARIACRAPRRGGGFTLVEVLVALAAMAVLAALAWRGLDAMVRTRDSTQEAARRAALLEAALSQWRTDLEAVFQSGAVPALRFDGATLRLTREGGGGVQVVAWSLREGAWWRRATPPVTELGALREQWQASAMGGATTDAAWVSVLPEARGVQVYFYRGNAWTNAQSTGDRLTPGAAQPPAETELDEQLPGGVRLVLDLAAGALTRDIVLSPQQP